MTPSEAYFLLKNNILKEDINLLEKIILNDDFYTYQYSLNVIKGPWKEGENIITSNPKRSYLYSLNVIKGPWKEGEKIISEDPFYSIQYAVNVLNNYFEQSHSKIFYSTYKDTYIHFLNSINYDYSEWMI
jgi:hypothetical protein